MKQWISLSEAAELSSYHPVSLRRLLRSKDIEGKKVVTVWLVERQSLLNYMQWARERGTRGRPRG